MEPLIWKRIPVHSHRIWNLDNYNHRCRKFIFATSFMIIAFTSGFCAPGLYFAISASEISGNLQRSTLTVIIEMIGFAGGCIYFTVFIIICSLGYISSRRLVVEYKKLFRVDLFNHEIANSIFFIVVVYTCHPAPLMIIMFLLKRSFTDSFKSARHNIIRKSNIGYAFSHLDRIPFIIDFISNIKNCNDKVINKLFNYVTNTNNYNYNNNNYSYSYSYNNKYRINISNTNSKQRRIEFSQYYESLMKYLINVYLLGKINFSFVESNPDLERFNANYLRYNDTSFGMTKTLNSSSGSSLSPRRLKSNSFHFDEKKNNENIDINVNINIQSNMTRKDLTTENENEKKNDNHNYNYNMSDQDGMAMVNAAWAGDGNSSNNDNNDTVINDIHKLIILLCKFDSYLIKEQRRHFLLIMIACFGHLLMLLSSFSVIFVLITWFFIYFVVLMIVNSFLQWDYSKLRRLIYCIDGICLLGARVGSGNSMLLRSLERKGEDLIKELEMNENFQKWIQEIMCNFILNVPLFNQLLIESGINGITPELCHLILQYSTFELTRENVIKLFDLTPENCVESAK